MKGGFGAEGPSTTVIVSAYQQDHEIALVLAALSAQSDLRFDVVIADDGSDPPIAHRVETWRDSFPFEVRCVWQEDRGFRKMRALNLAALQTEAQLLVFLDGDVVPYRNLIEIYRSAARPGDFLVGGYIFLGAEETRSLTPQAVRRGAHERRLDADTWWRLHSTHLSNLLNRRRRTRPRIRGGNFATAMDLFRHVDGFDEALVGYGKEDSELRNRMRNAGARGVSLWHRARACHLSREVVSVWRRKPTPRPLYEESFRLVRARVGLSSHPGRDASG